MTFRLGDWLVEQGLMTDAQRDDVLRAQQISGRPFGALAEELCGVDSRDVERAWAEQYATLTTWIDPRLERIDPAALAWITARQAWQFAVLPIRHEAHDLVVCTLKERLARALRFADRTLEVPCYFVLSEPPHLESALMRYYPVDGMDRAARLRAVAGMNEPPLV